MTGQHMKNFVYVMKHAMIGSTLGGALFGCIISVNKSVNQINDEFNKIKLVNEQENRTGKNKYSLAINANDITNYIVKHTALYGLTGLLWPITAPIMVVANYKNNNL